MKYIFIGNRMAVLNEMLLMKLQVLVLPVTPKKQDLINYIAEQHFDVLVSNGCPYILPVSQLKRPHQIWINIHPSLLPDLRGNSPILGAIKYNRPMGATVHIMDDGIDTGKVITQVHFEPKDRKDLGNCYTLSYQAEVQAFRKAIRRHFKPLQNQPVCKNPIYYSK